MQRLVILFFLLFTVGVAAGQSLKDLQEQKKAADRELIQINDQLNSTKKEKNSTMKQVALVHSMIEKRKKIIENIDRQVILLEKNVGVKTDTILKLKNDIFILKRQYAKTLQQAYKLRNSTSAIALILASNDLQQAIKRMKYLRSYSDYRIEQANTIELKQRKLNAEIIDLNAKKRNLEVLLANKTNEVKKLADNERTYQAMLDQLKSKEKDLLAEVQKKRLLRERLAREINILIAEEARKAAEAARRKAAAEEAARRKAAAEKKNSVVKQPTITAPKDLPFTPEDRTIAGKFEANRGRLPWPVRQGQIVETFGEHQHPLLKGVKVKNDGVDIASVAGSDITAVFDGEVSKIFTLPGANISVLVRHGYYITVYSNLSRVSVKEGQSIRAKQTIGILANSDTGGEKPILKFQVWKETTPQNPVNWLAR